MSKQGVAKRLKTPINEITGKIVAKEQVFIKEKFVIKEKIKLPSFNFKTMQ